MFSNALFIDSKASAAGSDFSSAEKNSDPVLSDQTFNCSTAAALKVSAATKPTFFPSEENLWAIFPTVAVFPTPFTPTINKICGSFFFHFFFPRAGEWILFFFL